MLENIYMLTHINCGLCFMIDDDIDDIEEITDNSQTKRKKLMILLLPIVVVIGLSVGLYFAFNNNIDSNGVDFNVVQYNKDSNEDATVFYDLPEVKVEVKGKDRNHKLRMKINIELSSVDDIMVVQAMSSRLTNAVLNHTVELYIEEIEGSTGLYWLKEELLYRFNLVAAPVKIKNLNFSVFELER